MIREKPVTGLFAPLAPIVPLAMLAVILGEMEFARHWSRQLRPGASGRLRIRQFPSASQFAERFA
jgi:hypothetical protein